MPAAKRASYSEDDHPIRYGTTTLLESVEQAWFPILGYMLLAGVFKVQTLFLDK